MNANTIAKSDRFVTNVRASTFRPRDDLYMLFVAVNTDDGTFEPVWLVPSTVFADRTKPNKRNRHRFLASMRAGTKDQWRKFRMDRSELPGRLLDILDSLT